MQKIETVSGTGMPLLLDDIDTDRIIPARFLRCVSFDGLGEHAFEDDRRQDPAHPFNDARFRGAKLLIAGRNFGCGSSREHAPQSLMRWGLQGIVAESFAEIFFGNCTSLGVPAVCAARGDLARAAAAVQANPALPLALDLAKLKLRFGSEEIACTMPDGAREALRSGQWDFLGQLLDNQPGIRKTASTLPYLKQFAG